MKIFLAIPLLVSSAGAALAADHVVAQKDRRFHPGDIAIAKGDAVTFTNNDEFIHQIFVDDQAFSVDTAEKAPGENVTEAFTTAGTFEVHCHIHPKMRLTVTVK